MADQELFERIYSEAFPLAGQSYHEEIEAVEVKLEDGLTLEAICFTRRGHTVLRVFPDRVENESDPEDVAALGLAWLEASWLRRGDDGLIAIANDEGTLGKAFVIPWSGVSPERVDRAIDALVSSAGPLAEPQEPVGDQIGDATNWVRI